MIIAPIEKRPTTVQALYEGHPERWTQGRNARTARWHEPCHPEDARAACWCLYSAVAYVYGRQGLFDEKLNQLKVTMRHYGIPHTSVVCYNDAALRAFGEILALVRAAKI